MNKRFIRSLLFFLILSSSVQFFLTPFASFSPIFSFPIYRLNQYWNNSGNGFLAKWRKGFVLRANKEYKQNRLTEIGSYVKLNGALSDPLCVCGSIEKDDKAFGPFTSFRFIEKPESHRTNEEKPEYWRDEFKFMNGLEHFDSPKIIHKQSKLATQTLSLDSIQSSFIRFISSLVLHSDR